MASTDERPADEEPVTVEPAVEPSVEKAEETEEEHASFLREIPILVLIALVIAILIKTFLVQAFFIPSSSMEPTLVPGDRVLVNKLALHLGDVHRGDVIVFENPDVSQLPRRSWFGGVIHWLGQGLGLQQPEGEDLIKRVIGLPGDTVEARNGEVYVNGQRLSEPYLPRGTTTQMTQVYHVPPNDLFVLGDNRDNSADSRVIGFIPKDKVVGRAFVIIWPPSDFGGLG